MQRHFPALLCLGLAVLPVNALAHGPHVHGVGELHVVIEDNGLDIELHGPLDNLIGFEHAPRTDAQRSAVKTMVTKLNNPALLFKLPAEASCKAGATQIDSPLTNAPKTGKGSPKESGGDGDHADLTATFKFSCEHIENLKSFEVDVFDAFPGTRTIKAEIVGLHGQSAKTLSPDDRSLKF